MQLKEVIHPEVILGRRGDPISIEIYQELLKEVKLTGEGGPIRVEGALTPYYHNDPNLLEHLVLCKLYKQSGGKAFYLPKAFAQALSTVDKALPVSILPERFLGYFHFGDFALQDESEWVQGGYVYIGRSGDIGLTGPADTKVAALSYVNKGEIGSNGIGRFAFTLENKKITDLTPAEFQDINLMPTSKSKQEVQKARQAVFRALINAAIYIHTADPELVRLPAEQELSNKKRSELRGRVGAENLCSIPITLVNKDYFNERTYSVDSTTVRGHLRWQPCGTGRTQVRLIWIDEHERHFH